MINKEIYLNIERREQQSSLSDIAYKSVIEGTGQVVIRYENNAYSRERLAYHSAAHTLDVVRRTRLILETIRAVDLTAVSEKDIVLGTIAASFHDSVQDWEENIVEQDGITSIKRKRFIKENECHSAEQAVAFMQKENATSRVFSLEDIETVREAIMATVPGFNSELGTVIQPNLHETSSVVVRAVALADIGTPGMDGAEKFQDDGDRLFIEENLDVSDAVFHQCSVTEKQKESYRQRILDWCESQSRFAAGRKALFEAELGNLSAPAKEAVRGLFSHFDEAIEGNLQSVTARKEMTYEQLLTDIGYPQSHL